MDIKIVAWLLYINALRFDMHIWANEMGQQWFM